MTPDLIYDQLIGAGCARKLTFSWGGNPGVGSLHRLRDAVENDWPRALEIDEHSHAGMAAAYRAGAARLPFGMLRGYIGTDLAKQNPRIREVACPYTGEEIATVPAINPDVTILHAQRADRRGNVAIDGIVGAAREAALAAAKLLVTVEDDRRRAAARDEQHRAAALHGDRRLALPGRRLAVLCTRPLCPRQRFLPALGRDRARPREFTAWIDRHVRGTRDHRAFLASLARPRDATTSQRARPAGSGGVLARSCGRTRTRRHGRRMTRSAARAESAANRECSGDGTCA